MLFNKCIFKFDFNFKIAATYIVTSYESEFHFIRKSRYPPGNDPHELSQLGLPQARSIQNSKLFELNIWGNHVKKLFLKIKYSI